jgi:hypothetical protein
MRIHAGIAALAAFIAGASLCTAQGIGGKNPIPNGIRTLPGCRGGVCVFDGLLNVPLGNAQLELTPAGLVVNNIGSSIKDGVVQPHLDDFGSRYMVTTIAAPNFSLSILGSHAEVDQIGFLNGQRGRLISSNVIDNFDGDNVEIMMTCGFFVPLYTVSVYEEGQLVGASDPHIFPPVIRFPKADFFGFACGLEDDGNLYTTIRWTGPIPIQIQTPNGFIGPFVGSCVRFQAFSPPVTLGLQEAIVNRFANTGPVTMTSFYAGPLLIPDTLCP